MKKNEKPIKSEPEVSLLVYRFNVVVEGKKDHNLEQMDYFTREQFPVERELVKFYRKLAGGPEEIEIVRVERTAKALITVAEWKKILRTQGQ